MCTPTNLDLGCALATGYSVMPESWVGPKLGAWSRHHLGDSLRLALPGLHHTVLLLKGHYPAYGKGKMQGRWGKIQLST